MKKILLTAMALLTIASASAFGMYGADNSWIFFLIHGNQMRARMNQFGFTLGNGTIKGTFGFKANTGLNGQILSTGGKVNKNPLDATISGGIGYTSDAFGIGLGYNYTFANTGTINGGIDAHTPVITLNALNNNLRIAIPISISVKDNLDDAAVPADSRRTKYLGISIPAQLRFYTGIDAFNYIRLEFNYGLNQYEGIDNALQRTAYQAQTIGFQLRLHFLNTIINNVTVNPFLRVDFASTIGAKGKTGVVFPGDTSYDGRLTSWAVNAWRMAGQGETGLEREVYDLKIIPSISLTVNSDFVNFVLEPGLGYRVQDDGIKGSKLTHSLYWQAYGEVYIRPTQDLEWYFEMDVNNGVPKAQGTSPIPVVFGANSGIHWYLPSLNPNAQ